MKDVSNERLMKLWGVFERVAHWLTATPLWKLMEDNVVLDDVIPTDNVIYAIDGADCVGSVRVGYVSASDKRLVLNARCQQGVLDLNVSILESETGIRVRLWTYDKAETLETHKIPGFYNIMVALCDYKPLGRIPVTIDRDLGVLAGEYALRLVAGETIVYHGDAYLPAILRRIER